MVLQRMLRIELAELVGNIEVLETMATKLPLIHSIKKKELRYLARIMRKSGSEKKGRTKAKGTEENNA